MFSFYCNNKKTKNYMYAFIDLTSSLVSDRIYMYSFEVKKLIY